MSVKKYLTKAGEIEDVPRRVHALLSYAPQFESGEQSKIIEAAEKEADKIVDPTQSMAAIAQITAARKRLQARLSQEAKQ